MAWSKLIEFMMTVGFIWNLLASSQTLLLFISFLRQDVLFYGVLFMEFFFTCTVARILNKRAAEYIVTKSLMYLIVPYIIGNTIFVYYLR